MKLIPIFFHPFSFVCANFFMGLSSYSNQHTLYTHRQTQTQKLHQNFVVMVAAFYTFFKRIIVVTASKTSTKEQKEKNGCGIRFPWQCFNAI